MKPGSKHTNETRYKIAAAQHGTWGDEERRAAQGERMRQHWADPEVRKNLVRAKLVKRAERIGCTVEALERPRTWAPAAERKRVLMDLYRKGLTQQEVWRLYPNEDSTILMRCAFAVRKEQEAALDELL